MQKLHFVSIRAFPKVLTCLSEEFSKAFFWMLFVSKIRLKTGFIICNYVLMDILWGSCFFVFLPNKLM